MTRRLQQEIQQKQPFDSLEEEVGVEIQRTAQVVQRGIAEALKPSGLTPQQFNVLRILRGARPEALSSTAICSRMIADDPDLTRLLDRLEAAGWVRKLRDERDRRVVNVSITPEGVALVETATVAVRGRLAAMLSPLGPKKLEQAANLLEQMRATAGPVEADTPEPVKSKNPKPDPRRKP